MASASTTSRSHGRPRLAWRWVRAAILDSRYVAEPEWLIGLGRLVTSAFAVIAIYFDPTQPGRLADEARLVTLAYLAFSLLALVPIHRPVDSKLHMLTHAIDILVLGWLLHLTDELTSPFFALFHFTLFAATIRWGMSGALLGAVVLEGLLLVIGLPDLEDGVSELNIMIMRSAYFLVAAFMLGYFGAYRNRSRYRLARLAAWPRTQPSLSDGIWLESILLHAADVIGSSCLAVLWQDVDESAGTVVVWDRNRLSQSRIEDPRRWALLDSVIESGVADPGLLTRLVGAEPQDKQFACPPDHVCSASFSGLRYRGRLIVADARYRHEEIDSLADIIAGRISYELERMALMYELAGNARVQERVRLARDLHDSVLQDLTAASLKLKSVARVTPGMEPMLAEVSAIMVDQQRRIRRFVEEARTGEDQFPAPNVLERHAEQLKAQWNCEVRLILDPPELIVTAELSAELAQIMSEATSNAVRHGGAQRLDFAITRQGGVLQLGIADDGAGITDDPAGRLRQPVSLAARVADLAGRLTVTRRRPGFALLIELPAP